MSKKKVVKQRSTEPYVGRCFYCGRDTTGPKKAVNELLVRFYHSRRPTFPEPMCVLAARTFKIVYEQRLTTDTPVVF